MKSCASTKSKRDRSVTPVATDATTTATPKAFGVALQVKKRAHALGFDLVGITTAQPPRHTREFRQWLASGFHGEMGYLAKNAEKRVDPSKILADVRSVVVVGLNYNADEHGRPPHLDPLPPQHDRRRLVGLGSPAERGEGMGKGRIARYAQGARDYHDVMSEKLKRLAAAIDECGGPGTRSLWYVDTGPILERDMAQRAGIGFIGKHTNLISRQLGNWIFVGEVLTNLELSADEPEREYCGTCQRCIDVCPTRAIVAPYQLDARLCISYLTIELKGSIPVELRPLIGDHVFGCDDCLDVCPWNRFAKLSLVREFQRRETPALTEFLSWDEGRFRNFFRGTPIFRIKRRGFLRNVCVVLGNIGGASTLPALEQALTDPEPLVREHAAWAIDQIHDRCLGTKSAP